MQTNTAGIELIKQFEGLRLEAYLCPAGKWTIGYGATLGVKQGMKITTEAADRLLRQDLQRFEIVVHSLRRKWTENEFSALVSFAYNCGAENLRTLCRDRSIEEIADAMLRYNKARNANGVMVELAGLTRRRQAERGLFLKKD